MTMIAAATPEEATRTLGEFTAIGETDRWTVKLDAVAATHADVLQIVSVAGPETSIQAVRAMLAGAGRGKFRVKAEGFSQYINHKPCPFGYTFSTHNLGLRTYHLLAIAKMPGLLPTLSDEALYQEFKSERYTTPLIRDFIPWIKKQLLTDRKLQPLTCFQCEAAVLYLPEQDLDELVESGVTFGHLEIC